MSFTNIPNPNMMDNVFTNLLIIGLLALSLPLAAQQTPTFTIDPASATVAPGDILEVAVTVSEFQNIVGQQYAVKWDPAVFEFVEIVSTNSTDFPGFSDAPGVTISVPGGNVPAGQVNISWFEPSFTPITVTDGTEVFTISLSAIACGNSAIIFDDPGGFVSIEILADDNGSLIDVDMNPENGTATVDGPNCQDVDPVEVTFTIPDSTIDVGDQVCMPVLVTDFTNIDSVQLSIEYDDNLLVLDSITEFNLMGLDSSDFDTTGMGTITLDWMEAAGATVENDSAIFEICFTSLQAGTSGLTFTDNPLLINVGNTADEDVLFNGTDGSVTINDPNSGSGDDLTGYIENAIVDEGTDFCLEITVDNFVDMLGMDFSIAYDDAMLAYTGISNINPGLVGFSEAGNTGNPAPGSITVQYFNQLLQPITLPDGAVMFELCFTAISDGTSAVNFSDSPTAIEFIDISEAVVPFTSNSGTVTINDNGGPVIPDNLFLTIPDQTVDPGESFCVPLEVYNFEGVIGMSFIIEYDTSFLSFDQAVNLNTNLPSFSAAANVANPSPGIISVIYIEPTLSTPISLTDGAVLMELCFTAESMGVSTDLDITGNMTTPFDFIDINEENITASSAPGTITITGAFPGLTIEAEDLTVTPGEEFCMEVTTTNFEDIQGMSYAMTYDPSILQLEAITNLNPNIPGFTNGNFSTGNPGVIAVLWVEPTLSSVTLPDNAVLYEVCFTAVGADGQCDDVEFGDVPPTTVEITDSNEDIVDVFFEPGTVCIDDNVAGQVQLNIANTTVAQDASFCLPVTTDNFSNITDFSFTIEYDESHLQLDNVSNLNGNLSDFSVANNIDTSTPGVIAVSWSAPGAPQNLPDNAKLFDLCFTAIGDPNSSSDVVFTGTAEPISFTSSVEGMLAFNGGNGRVTIQPLFDGFLLTIADDNVQPGENFCVPVTVLNFENVASFSFGVCYDETQLQFQSVMNPNENLSSYTVSGSFALPGQGQIPDGLITTTWVEPSLTPVNLADGEILFEVCFEAIGSNGDVSDITFCDTPTNMIEVTDGENEIEFNGENGTINISAIQPPSIASVDIQDVNCNGGADGAISIMVTGGTGGPYSYTWSNSETGSSISGLASGSYTVTVADNGNGGLMTTQTYTVSEPTTALSLNGGVAAPSCEGGSNGSVTLMISGGTSPYDISWDSGIQSGQTQPSNLPAGTYCATITDANGCTIDDCFTVPDGFGDGPMLSADITAVSCPGGDNGQITLTATNVNGTVSYFWNTNPPSSGAQLSGLPAGSYTVTAIDDASCSTMETYQVGTVPPIVISPVVEVPTCVGDANGSIQINASGGNGGYTFEWLGPNGYTNTGSAISGLSAGIYTVTVRDAADCVESQNIEVAEPDPISVAPAVQQVNCRGEATGAISLTVTNAQGSLSYNWTGPNNFTSSNGNISNLLAGVYNLTLQDAAGCTQTASVSVTEPTDGLTINSIVPTPINTGNDGAVNLTVSGGTPPYSYSWIGPNGFMASTEDLTGLNVGGQYCVTVMDARGCTMTDCAAVNNVLRISSSFITDACFGESNGAVSLSVTGGTPPYSYAWSPVSGSGPDLMNLSDGTYSVTITDSDSPANTITSTYVVSASAAITVNPSLTPVLGDPGNTNGSITLNASGGTPPLSYSWIGPNGFSANTANLSSLGTGTYCVTITDSNLSNNCAWDTCFNVNFIMPMSAPELTVDGTSCFDAEDGSITVVPQGGAAPYTITVTTADGEEVTQIMQSGTSVVIENLPAGATTVSITDAFGDSVSNIPVMIERPDPITGTVQNYQHATAGNCDGAISLTVTGGTPGYTVSWDNGGGSGMMVDSLCGGAYTPTITDANGCVVTLEDSVAINEFGAEVTEIVNTNCPDDEDGSIDITVSGGDPDYTFSWINSIGEEVSTNEDPSNLPAGDYTVIISEPSGNTISVEVTIISTSTLAVSVSVDSDYNGFEVSCPDAADGVVSASATGSAGYMYQWVNTATNMLVANGPTAEDLEAGTYSLLVDDEDGCTVGSTVTLEAPDTVTIDGFVKGVRCTDGRNGIITLEVKGGLSPYDYFWDTGDFGDRISLLSPGDYTVTVIDDNNCESSATFNLENPEPIQVMFESEPATDGCNGVVLATAAGGTAPYTFNWQNVDGGSNEQQLFNLCPGEYFVQVEDDNGCLSAITSFQLQDRRFPCLDERVVITPDGDGQNEEFIILCLEDYTDNQLEIYNRWGQLVFETENYDNTWTGTDQSGNPLPEGPYYYVIVYTDPEGNIRQQKGSLSILREN